MTPSRAPRPLAPWLLGALALALAGVNLAFFFPRLVDDAFITLRYAENLVEGHGLVFNRGQWVEGFSSLTWVLVQAAGLWAGLDGITATKIAALLATAALLTGVFRMARELFGVTPAWAAAATALVAANSYVMSWCVYGLETPLYLALLVWFGVMVRRVAEDSPSVARAVVLAFVGIALALTRPEAPLMLFVVGLGSVRWPDDARELSGRARRLAAPALAVMLGYGAWLVARHQLYGHWLPHTYFAKRGAGLELSHLAALFGEGASPAEWALWTAAPFASIASFVATRRLLVPLALLANFFFVVKVELDWMPNVRHLLPAFIFASLGVVGLSRFGARRWRIATFALVAALGAWFVSVDSRFSRYEFATHGAGVAWVRHKTTASMRSALSLLRREDPPGFEEARPDHLGLIDLTFLAVEASSRPERETWFIGQDIGMVGYFSHISIYDTVGLFTPEVIEATGGDERAPVPDEVIAEAFTREIVAGEIYGPWAAALGRHPAITRRYAILLGTPVRPVRFTGRADERPSASELEARYERLLRRLPPHFHFAELYGSPAGPAVELRARVAVERARDREARRR